MIRLRIAATYEIVAGFIGLASGFHSQQWPNGRAVRFNIYAAALALGSIVLGFKLWSGGRRARRFSLAFQLLQVPRIASTAVILSLLVGVEGTLQFQGPLVSLFTTTGVTFFALHPYTPRPTVVGLNLVAATVAALVWQSDHGSLGAPPPRDADIAAPAG